jgi:hypothetical protein
MTKILVLLFAMATQSCTVKKRIYRPGVHIVWKHKSRTKGHDFETKNQNGKRIEPKTALPNSTVKKEENSNAKEIKPAEPTLSEYAESVKKQKNKKPATKDLNRGWSSSRQ